MSLPFSLVTELVIVGLEMPNEAAAFSVTLKVASFGYPVTMA